jgi:Flp pilus assembly protein TadD
MTTLNSRIIVPVAVVAVVITTYFVVTQFVIEDSIEQPTDQATIQDYRTQANEHLEKKEYQQALDILLKLEIMAPEDVAVHYSVARLYQAAGKKAEARAALESGIPYIKDPEANEAYAKLLSELE